MRFTALLSFALSALVVSALPIAKPDDTVTAPVTDTPTTDSPAGAVLGLIGKNW
ncbi:hypothetical protein FS837_010225, partial [Tulasnella sp. UAMH 9824]